MMQSFARRRINVMRFLDLHEVVEMADRLVMWALGYQGVRGLWWQHGAHEIVGIR